MAAPALIPDDKTVYRGLSNANWCKGGVVQFKAFMLRPAKDPHPIEEELSLGRTPEAAVDELKENFGAAGLLVQDVYRLSHGLKVTEDSRNASKAYLLGLPLFSTDQDRRDLAIAVATDLANLSHPVSMAL
jgi:hypothetical protein